MGLQDPGPGSDTPEAPPQDDITSWVDYFLLSVAVLFLSPALCFYFSGSIQSKILQQNGKLASGKSPMVNLLMNVTLLEWG